MSKDEATLLEELEAGEGGDGSAGNGIDNQP